MSGYINKANVAYNENILQTLHNGKIKIESGEQFVPLYLALLTTGRGMYSTFSHWDVNPTKEDYKLWLMERLNEGVPTEYSFIAPEYKYFPENQKEKVDIFFGNHSQNDYPHLFQESSFGMFVTLGLCARIPQQNSGVTMKSKDYLPTSLQSFNKIIPEVLVIVKAKHLSYLRSCVLLNSPSSEIPYSDIKMLRATTLEANTSKDVVNMLEEHEIQKLYASTEMMLSYLIKPFKALTAEQVLNNTKKIVNYPELKLTDCLA